MLGIQIKAQQKYTHTHILKWWLEVLLRMKCERRSSDVTICNWLWQYAVWMRVSVRKKRDRTPLCLSSGSPASGHQLLLSLCLYNSAVKDARRLRWPSHFILPNNKCLRTWVCPISVDILDHTAQISSDCGYNVINLFQISAQVMKLSEHPLAQQGEVSSRSCVEYHWEERNVWM